MMERVDAKLIKVVFGDVTAERAAIDPGISEDHDHCNIAVCLGDQFVLPMTTEEADELANELRAVVDSFQKFVREKIIPKQAEYMVRDAMGAATGKG